MRFLFLYFLFTLLLNTVKAQDSLRLDSTRMDVKKTRFVFSFDSRWSRVHRETARITGFKIGWERFEKNRYGIGIYALRDPIELGKNKGEIYKNAVLPSEDVDLQSNLNYLVLFWDHLLVNKKRAEISINTEFGPATAQLQYLDEVNLNEQGLPSTVILEEVEFSIFEVSVTGHYKILPWIGPGVGFGYRSALSSDKNVQRAFSGPVGIIKLKIFIGAIYRGIFPKKK